MCIVTDEGILLLVQDSEDKRHKEPTDPEPQLIAETIAAFSANNYTRTRTLGLPAFPNKTIPGMLTKGTSPIFYKLTSRRRSSRPLPPVPALTPQLRYTPTYLIYHGPIGAGAKE